MPSIAIVDSGPLIASAVASDPDHHACLEALRTPGIHLVIPALCVAEAAYFIASRGHARAEAAFLRGLRDFDVRSPEPEDWVRIGDLVEHYAELPLGATDASVVALAERVHTDLVITLDRRHFGIVRTIGRDALRLLP